MTLLSHLQSLLEAATPGPYNADLDRFNDEDGIEACVSDVKINLLARIGTDITEYGDAAWARARDGQALKDARLLAAAVNSLPALLRVARAAEAWRAARLGGSGATEHELVEAVDALSALEKP